MTWEATRRAILERDDYTCQYCFHRPKYLRTWNYRRWRGTLHVDHVYPVSRGGSNSPMNLVTACEACNLAKGANIWIPSRVRCVFCFTFHTDHDHEYVRVDPDGVWWKCGDCMEAEAFDESRVAYSLEVWEVDHIADELAYYDSLIEEGWDVAA